MANNTCELTDCATCALSNAPYAHTHEPPANMRSGEWRLPLYGGRTVGHLQRQPEPSQWQRVRSTTATLARLTFYGLSATVLVVVLFLLIDKLTGR